uniref:RNA helicase n=1 Tax=Eutreptiella gymnastica TaxID=73025 RepID=A0A7S1IPH2_9EUGL
MAHAPTDGSDKEATQAAMEAELRMLRTELELKRKETELANLQAMKYMAATMGAPMHPIQPNTSLSPQQAAMHAVHHTQSGHPLSGAPQPALSRPAPHTWTQPEAKRPRAEVTKPNAAPPSYSDLGLFGAHQVIQPAQHGARDVASMSPSGHALHLQKMALRLQQPQVPKGMLYQLATDILFDMLLPDRPDDSVARNDVGNVSEALFQGLFDRIMAESQTPNIAHWDAQEVKTFFEVGVRLKRYSPQNNQRRMTRFAQYVDMLNLFITKPATDMDIPLYNECWLRPTVAAALLMGKRKLLELQSHVVPETALVGSDVLVSVYWDLELDLYRFVPNETGDDEKRDSPRRKRGTTKMACSILQSCDWASYRPQDQPNGPKAPPVIVVCHSKAMVLRLADTLNFLARYEYKMGYRGAEAAYGDAGVTNQPVSVLVCTAARLKNDMQAGAVSLSACSLLVFTFQDRYPANEKVVFALGDIVQQAPATTRTMIFHSSRLPASHVNQAAAQILRRDPVEVIWESDESNAIVVTEFILEEPIPQPVPRPQAQSSAARPQTMYQDPASDFEELKLHPSLTPALRNCNTRGLTLLHKGHMQTIMTGRDYLFPLPNYNSLVFVIPTMHLMMHYTDTKTRVLIIVSTKEEVDEIVAEYLSLTSALPSFGIVPEGLHSSRTTEYTTPVNYQASVIIGTTMKFARDVEAGQIDVSSVDAVIIPHGERIAAITGPGRNSPRDIYNMVRDIKGHAPQLLAFSEPAKIPSVEPLVRGISPGVTVVGPGAHSADR